MKQIILKNLILSKWNRKT